MPTPPTTAPAATSPTVPISWGECVDKVTILEIKLGHVRSPTAQANVERELGLLTMTLIPLGANETVAELRRDLLEINSRLWDVEDRIREKEAASDFGEAFVALARQVYHLNDKRAALKRQINEVTNSLLIEEKIYVGGKV